MIDWSWLSRKNSGPVACSSNAWRVEAASERASRIVLIGIRDGERTLRDAGQAGDAAATELALPHAAVGEHDIVPGARDRHAQLVLERDGDAA